MDEPKYIPKSKTKIFITLYAVGFVGLLIIGFFSLLSFSRAAFNSVWANALLFIFIALLFITAFVHDILTANSRAEIIVDVFVFLISLALLILNKYVGGITKLCVLLYAAVIIGVVVFRHILQIRKNQVTTTKYKHFIALTALLISVINVHESYVDETYIAWALIPAAVITCVACLAAYMMLREQLVYLLPTKAKRIGIPTVVVLVTFIPTLCYSFSTIATINSMFDSDPTPAEYIVFDTSEPNIFDSGADYTVTVEIDGQEQQIKISANDSLKIQKGDKIIIDYYKGALGFPYYKYKEKVEE